jgi:general secretion pathway protein D
MKLIRGIFLVAFLVTVLSAREQVNVNFSNLKIDDFIKLISKITHKNILVNNKINGTVNFVSTTPVYDDELIGMNL